MNHHQAIHSRHLTHNISSTDMVYMTCMNCLTVIHLESKRAAKQNAFY